RQLLPRLLSGACQFLKSRCETDLVRFEDNLLNRAKKLEICEGKSEAGFFLRYSHIALDYRVEACNNYKVQKGSVWGCVAFGRGSPFGWRPLPFLASLFMPLESSRSRRLLIFHVTGLIHACKAHGGPNPGNNRGVLWLDPRAVSGAARVLVFSSPSGVRREW